MFDAAVTSAVVYSGESWLTNNMKSLERHYNKLVKCLLGVIRNTSINLWMIESGVPSVGELIGNSRKSFLRSKFENVLFDHSFYIAYDLCRLGYKL